jgi:hypothetical protein
VRLHIVSILNGNIPLGDEEVVFQLTHTSWRCKNGVSIDTFLGDEMVMLQLTHTSWR